jgi:hypothetical protein
LSLSSTFLRQNPVCSFSPSPHVPHDPPTHSSGFGHPNNIWWGVHIMELLITEFSPSGRYFLLRPNCFVLTDHFEKTNCWVCRYSFKITKLYVGEKHARKTREYCDNVPVKVGREVRLLEFCTHRIFKMYSRFIFIRLHIFCHRGIEDLDLLRYILK